MSALKASHDAVRAREDNGGQESKCEHRQGKLTAIELHGYPPVFDYARSLAAALQFVEQACRGGAK